MLVSATLDSSYVALAMYAGSQVLLALARVLLAGPVLPKLTSRYAGTVLPAVVRAGHLLLVLAWGMFTLQAFRVYRPVSSALFTLLDHELRVGELSLSLGGLLAFCLATWAAFWLARTVRVLLAETVLPGLSLPRGVGNSISSLSYYTVLFLGLLAALAAAGFHVGQLALIFGALGVGIGFGLQDVVRNFVAGLILMFERPIQRGDTVEVAGMLGRVGDIGLRATTITTFDGADVVVPNGLLLADKLVNWTFAARAGAISLDFGIAHAVDRARSPRCWWTWPGRCAGVSAVTGPTAIVIGFAERRAGAQPARLDTGPYRLGVGAQRTGDARARGPGGGGYRGGAAAARPAACSRGHRPRQLAAGTTRRPCRDPPPPGGPDDPR